MYVYIYIYMYIYIYIYITFLDFLSTYETVKRNVLARRSHTRRLNDTFWAAIPPRIVNSGRHVASRLVSRLASRLTVYLAPGRSVA